MAEEYLPDDFMVNTMRVEYRMQAVLGNIIVPLVSIEEDRYTVALADETHKPYAIIEFHKSV
jgi:hypothetical protein